MVRAGRGSSVDTCAMAGTAFGLFMAGLVALR